MQRDGDVTGDDFVSVVLDTYGDRRTGYFVRVNAAGARVDGLLAGPEDPSLDWDGIWDARTFRSAEGWSAEIMIPSRTFVQRLWQWNMTYAFHPNLVLTNFLQYDTESQNVGNNMRLRWTLKPGNDLFVVWNRGWKRVILSPDDIGLAPDTEVLAVKLRWTFRK